MHFQSLSLLALAYGGASVSAVSFAGLAYRPSSDMMAMAEANNCTLPGNFRIADFIGTSSSSNSTGDSGSGRGSAVVLDSLNFKFGDQTTQVNTFCQWNTSSTSTTPSGLTPRFSCENHDVKFIWEGDKGQLTAVERICPDATGKKEAEVAGSVQLSLTCDSRGICTADPTDIEGTYYSIGPILDPTSA